MQRDMDEYEAAFYSGGNQKVNDLLVEQFPEVRDRVERMLALEATGRWGVQWHHSDDEDADQPDDGVVVDYSGAGE